jgi:uncharacterized membrane protein
MHPVEKGRSVSMQKKPKMITELTDILDQDIETIVALRMTAERTVSRHQRLIERSINALSRPRSLYLIVLFIVLWILISLSASNFHLPWSDPAPFFWLQGIIACGSIFLTTGVLITQSRQSMLAEQRRHLDLQINLLTERKVSKLIELIEEIRSDLGEDTQLIDPEVEAMKEPIDPHTALTALNETLQVAAQTIDFEHE